MDLNRFLEGPFLWTVFSLFLVGVVFHGVRSILSLSKDHGPTDPARGRRGGLFFLSFLPFHRGAFRYPFYTALRYVFHLCLVAVPIGFSGHIALWEESALNWTWGGLSDAWADGMTLLVLLLAAFFLVRRLVLKEVRRESSSSDYVLILLTALPFLTGYFLTHGTLDGLGPDGGGLRALHVLSGAALLLAPLFLWVDTRLSAARCTACGSCATACPTGALETRGDERTRVFRYTPSRCILCGGCVEVCPEGAAALRHGTGLLRLLKGMGPATAHSVRMGICRGCGAALPPIPQLDAVGAVVMQEYVHYCERCKRESVARLKLGAA